MPKRYLFLDGICPRGHKLNSTTLAEFKRPRGIVRYCRMCNSLYWKMSRFRKKMEEKLAAEIESNQPDNQDMAQ